MDKIRTSCPGLPTGWKKEVVIRKTGASAGKSDVYYYSPEGKKCRSKPQMLQYLPDDFDLDSFEFRAGKNSYSSLKKRKRHKDGFNFGKDFNMSLPLPKLSRQMKKTQNSNVMVVSGKDVEGEKNENIEVQPKRQLNRNTVAETDMKKRRAVSLSQRHSKPRQLFWQRRLQNIQSVNEKTMEPCRQAKFDAIIKDLLPGSNNQALLNSLGYALFTNNKIVGQHAPLNALRKHPTALCNTEQPFTSAITITDEMLQMQEKRVEEARKRLTDAQDLLKALAEEEDDYDDLEE